MMITLCTMPPLWLLLFLLGLLPLIIILLKSKQERRTNLPPGPPKLPIIGNLHQLGELPHRSLCQLSKEYGPVMLLQLGRMPTLVVSSAEIASEIMKSQDLKCCNRPDMMGPRRLSYNNLDIAFSSYNDYWREMRKVFVLELVSVKRVQSFQSIREERVASMISSISKSSQTPINLSELLFTLAKDVTCSVAFGRSSKWRELDGRFGKAFDEAMFMLGSFSGTDFFPYVGWVLDKFTGLHGRLEKCFHEFDDFYETLIDEHLNNEISESEQEDIVDVLLKVGKDDHTGAGPLTKDNIKAMLMNIFIGGVDTSAVTIVWAMTELARNPKVMKKVQDEVRSCVGKKGKVVEGVIDHLKFLKMVVKETLRLHSPVPLLVPRETIDHFTINGYDIYPKTRVQVNVWAIARDPKYWKNPEEFMPERFMDNSIDYKGTHFELLPFGAGRRGCPGLFMASSLVELTLAKLLYAFDWGFPDGMKKEDIDMDETAGITLKKKAPLYLVPVKHNWDSEENIPSVSV